MAESRDRLIRVVDPAEVFARRRSGPLGILSDEAMRLLGSSVPRPVTHRTVGVVGVATTSMARGRGGLHRGGGGRSFGTPGTAIIRSGTLYRFPAPGRENALATATAVGRGRGSATRSLLPSWYPRTPLRDITPVIRAIERRRASLGEDEGHTPETPSQDERVLHSAVSSGALLEHNFCTPAPTARRKPCPPSVLNVSKILHKVANQTAEESEFLTPQKKLLNSIDTVEKVVMEELQRLERTPSAKREERKRKVRTLMSMR